MLTRGLLRLRLWHATLPGVCHRLRTSGVAFPFVLERLSNTPARLQEHARFEPWEAVGKQPMGGCSLGAPTLLAEAAALAWHDIRAGRTAPGDGSADDN